MMKAVSFMYIRPPGYDPESAKAAEIAENTKKQEADNPSEDPASNADSAAMQAHALEGFICSKSGVCDYQVADIIIICFNH